jgi:transposase-like protein
MSLRNVEDLLRERGIDICHETARFWWHWFGGKPQKSVASVLQSSVLI